MDETSCSSWNEMPLVEWNLFSNEKMDEILDSSWNSGSKVTETCSSWRVGVARLSHDKALLKLRDWLLEHEKKKSKSNFFSGKYFVLKSSVSTNDSMNGVPRIVGKERIVDFTLKEDALLDAERLGREK